MGAQRRRVRVAQFQLGNGWVSATDGWYRDGRIEDAPGDIPEEVYGALGATLRAAEAAGEYAVKIWLGPDEGWEAEVETGIEV